MYTTEVNKLFEAVSAFRRETDRLERQIEQEKGDSLDHLDGYKHASGALMMAVKEFETALSGAADLIRDSQQIFRRLLSGFFCRSRYVDHGLKKPRGYAGDYLMLEMIYQGELAPRGMERVLDKFVLDLPMARAVVDRKESVKRWLQDRLKQHSSAKVVDLACGSCRMERELLEEGLHGRPTLVLVDHDPDALAYSQRLLRANGAKLEFLQANALNLARGKGHEFLAGANYVVSLGLLEYLPHQVCVRLLKLLRETIAPGAEILICNFDEDNPDQAFLEWVADWQLLYRNSHDFFGMFIEAGFDKADLQIHREREGGMVLQLAARVR